MTSIQALRERRQAKAAEARKLLDSHTGDKWTKEVAEQVDALYAEIDDIETQIRAYERQLKIEGDAAEATDAEIKAAGTLKPGDVDPTSPKAIYNKWLRKGDNALTAEEWATVRATMSTTTGSEGGYTAPNLISSQLYDAMKAFGTMRQVAEVITTGNGLPLSFPGSDGTSEVGELIAQNATATAADPSFTTVALNVFKYSSKIVAVPLELLQDSTVDIEAFVRNRLAQRLGRIGNQHFTTGTGSGQPYGVITAATVGKTGTTGQTLTIIFDDIIDLIHSVDPAYRGAQCVFTTNDSLLKVIRKLKDSQNRPLWVPSFEAGIVRGVGVRGGFANPDTPEVFDYLLGYPLYVNNDIASPAANAVTMSFGDHSYYKVRDALDVQMFRFTDSAYTKLGQVGFLAWARFGGNLVDSLAVKTYKHSAT